MNINYFIKWCIEQKVTFSVDGDNLRVATKSKSIPPDMLEAIKERKAELVAWLKEQQGKSLASKKQIVAQPRTSKQLPLSFSQQRLWFIEQLETSDAQYNVPVALMFKGPLQMASLQYALDIIIERHEILRSVYREVDGEAVQVVEPAKPLSILVVDYLSYGYTKQDDVIKSLIASESSKPFDLSKDLMVRLTLIKLSAEENILVLVMHHIASDGWSLGVFEAELIQLYEAHSSGKKHALTPLPIQYADYAVWQQQYLNEKELKRQCDYWLGQLSGQPLLLDLPGSKVRPQQQTFTGRTLIQSFDNDLLDKLNQLSRKLDVTLFMLLETTLALLLARFSQQQDIVVGSPISGRNYKEIEPLIGFFINTLVLRTQLKDDMSFKDLIEHNRENILQAFSHQEMPFDLLVEKLELPRSLSYSPVLQIVFALQNNQPFELSMPDFAIEHVNTGKSLIKFDLELVAFEVEQGLLLNWNSSDRIFDEQTMEALGKGYELLLYGIVADPNAAIYQLPVTSDEDLTKLADWAGSCSNVGQVIDIYTKCHSGGAAVAGVRSYVLDNQLNPLPVGVPGHLYLGIDEGSNPDFTALDYEAQESACDSVLHQPNESLVKTNHWVRYNPEGQLEFICTVDEMVNVAGLPLSLYHVRKQLQSLDSVTDAAVVALENENGKKIAAYIVPTAADADQAALVEKVTALMAGVLPDYLQPDTYHVVENITRKADGTVDVEALPKPWSETQQNFVAARTKTELALTAIWQDILGKASISIHDNFFDLGGNSLRAMRIVAAVSKQFDIGNTLRVLFEKSTIAKLAAYIDSQNKSAHVTIESVAKDQPLPLSFAQQRLWFIDQMANGSNQYNMPAAMQLSGNIDILALHRAFTELVVRHEILRTTYGESGGQGVQIVNPAEDIPLDVVDLSSIDTSLQSKEVERISTEEAGRPFDLSKDLMLRVRLLKLADTEHVLLCTMHHIASDGWSVAILVDEFASLYESFRGGREHALQPLPIQYGDFAHWQRNTFTEEKLEAQLKYWSKVFEAMPLLHSLPLDKMRPKRQSLVGGSYYQHIDNSLLAQLNSVSSSLDVTLFMLLESAFALLVARWSNSTDVIIGTPVAGRIHKDIEPLIGFFVNSLPLRTRFAKGMSFAQLLEQNKTTVLEAFSNQDIPFEMLVEGLQPERSLSYTPIFQLMFGLQNNEQGELTLPELSIQPLPTGQTMIKFDMELMATEQPDGLALNWSFATSLFELDTIKRMAASFECLLAALVHEPQTDIYHLPLTTKADIDQIKAFNDNAEDYPDACIHHIFEQQVAKTPEADALEHQGTVYSYTQVNQKANKLTRYLQQRGLKSGVLVGLCVDRSAESIFAMLAVLKAGASYVPLDPGYPRQRLEYMIQDSGVELVLTQSHLLEQVPVSLDRAILIDSDDSYLSHSANNLDDIAVTGEDQAYVIYTSGSTGNPKGVSLRHAGAINLALNQIRIFELSSNSRALQFASISFDASISEWLMALLSGACLFMCPEECRTNPSKLTQYLIVNKISHLTLPPVLLAQLDLTDLYHFESLIIAGEACEKQITWQWAEKYRLFNAYGPSEGTVCTSAGQVLTNQRITIGHALKNVSMFVLDDHGGVAPIGVAGELYIGGAGLASHYLNRPELTVERFSYKFARQWPQERLYRTGDSVRCLADGSYEFFNRVDDQVKIRGHRIELGEVRAALVKHLLVADAFVMSRQIGTVQQLVAYVVLSPEIGIDSTLASAQNKNDWISKIKVQLRESLPEYMVPAFFVFINAIPLTINGKVDSKALPSIEKADSGKTSGSAPNSRIEHQLCRIWQQVLGLEQVGIYDNFFDIGGNSILCIQIQKQIAINTDYEIDITDLFEYPTINELSRYLSSSADETLRNTQAMSGLVADVHSQDVAIIGMSLRVPDADTVEQFWDNISNGVESLQEFSDEQLLEAGVGRDMLNHPNYVKSGVLLPDINTFDTNYFGFTPREAEVMDPQQRLLFECSNNALENAGYGCKKRKRDVGVFVGVAESNYFFGHLMGRTELEQTHGFGVLHANSSGYMATRLAYKLNLNGPSINVATACSTSLVAIHQACNSLLLHESKMAIAGGARVGKFVPAGYMYIEGGIVSPDGHCRAFDKDAQGTRSGDGAGIIVLKRLDDAIADGDTIHAVIKGTAVNNDGSDKVGFTAPSVSGQSDVITRCQAIAGVKPESIQYVETHGTGTKLGDPIEIKALTKAFAGAKHGFCALGSLKPNIGHLDAAAGVVSVIKTVQALKAGMIPPSINYSEANPGIDFANTPFYVNTELREWTTSGGPRRAGVSSFGIGGTNAHAILEQAPDFVVREARRSEELVVLSAKTETALAAASEQLVQHLKNHPEQPLNDIGFTLKVGRTAHEHRCMLVAKSVEHAIEQLQSGDGVSRHSFSSKGRVNKSVVLLFTGQGSQYVNMAKELYEQEPVFRQQLDECANILNKYTEVDIRDFIYPLVADENAKDKLNQTSIAQPALFCVEYAMAALLQSWGIIPSAMIGHSIGEYVAACLAGVFNLEDALKLVSERARLMQRVDPGDMISVPMAASELQGLLQQTGCSMAAVNGPQSCVASGPSSAIEALTKALEGKGVAVSALHTSHAFHSSMMDVIVDDFRRCLEQVCFNAPQLAYISNVSGKFITEQESSSVEYWVRHLRGTVNFAAGINTLLYEQQLLNVDKILIEVGPGISLTSLARKSPHATGQVLLSCIRHPNKAVSDLAFVSQMLGQLWLQGCDIDWQGYYQDSKVSRVPLPTYPYERQKYWIEAVNSKKGPAVTGCKQSNINDWFCAPTFRLESNMAIEPIDLASEKQCWLIFADSYGLGAELGQSLARQSQNVVMVNVGEQFARLDGNHYVVNLTTGNDYQLLKQSLDDAGLQVVRIVHCWSIDQLGCNGSDKAEVFEARQHYGVYSVLAAIKQFAPMQSDHRLQVDVVTQDIYRVTGEEQINRDGATVTGLCKVVPQEYPQIKCNVVDLGLSSLSSIDSAALKPFVSSLLSELCLSTRSADVAFRGRQRWVGNYVPHLNDNSQIQARAIKPQGIYLITGGLGNIGLLLGGAIAEQEAVRIAFVGRSEFPAVENWEQWLANHPDGDPTSTKINKLKALQASGAEVMVCAGDVADFGQMSAVFDRVETRWGRIDGVIHAAGLLHGSIKTITETTTEDFAQQYQSKVKGLLVLEQLLEGRKIDFCLLMSSLSSVLGGLGFAAYASANVFMDAFARQKHNDGDLRWLSVNWDGWNFTALGQAAMFGDQLSMLPDEGIKAFKRALATGIVPQLVNSTGVLEQRLQRWLIEQDDRGKMRVYARPELDIQYVEPSSEIEFKLLNVWQELLGIREIGIKDDFFELGGDSVVATRILSVIRQRFGVDESVFGIKDFFENPTIEKVSQKLTAGLELNKASEMKSQLSAAGKNIEEGVL